jgi:hypothetical protein
MLLITIKLLDFVHRPDFYKQKTQRFGNWICFRLQERGGDTYSTEKQKLAFPQAMPEQKKKEKKKRCYCTDKQQLKHSNCRQSALMLAVTYQKNYYVR